MPFWRRESLISNSSLSFHDWLFSVNRSICYFNKKRRCYIRRIPNIYWILRNLVGPPEVC